MQVSWCRTSSNLVVLMLLALGSARASCPAAEPAAAPRVFFGDLHVHTSYSIDGYAVGTRFDPSDAFAFAKGQELTLSDGRTRVRLQRPLDFAAVTDHAEYFDVTWLCADPNYDDSPYCQEFRKTSRSDGAIPGFRRYVAPLFSGPTTALAPVCDATNGQCREARRSQWRRAQQMANEANEPCRFTAFIGNEWSATPNSKHWHRNLIFSGDKVPLFPVNSIDQPDLASMWSALENQCRPEQGCDVVAIPHNMNLAEGGGFDVESSTELSLRQRARYERLAEIYQHKGASECLPKSGKLDDDCDFELMLPPRLGQQWRQQPDPKIFEMLRPSYYRSLLARGLIMQQRAGINPLQLGVVASTDTHNATPGAVDEDVWRGHFGGDVEANARFALFPDASPGGLVGVWAAENTRASLFAALQRREVYGTSGPRIVLRFDALSRAVKNPCQAAMAGVDRVVMGGTLPGKKAWRPQFVVQALMDNVPIEKIEVVRGVLVRDGVQERVIPLQLAGESAGTALCAVFVDTDYDPSRPAYWYARVQERPTRRWSKIDCEAMNNCTPRRDRMIRERAWSSPIWRLP